MTSRHSTLAAAAADTGARTKAPPSDATQPDVQVSAKLSHKQRAALGLAGAHFGLSLSTTISALAEAAAAEDERVAEILADYADSARRPRGVHSHRS